MSSRTFALVLAALCCIGPTDRAEEPCASRAVFATGKGSEKLPGVTRKKQSIFVSVRVKEKNNVLQFLFDTGAGRTVIDRRVAARLGLQATIKSSIAGVGAGQVPVDVVQSASLRLGNVRLDGVNLDVTDTPESEHVEGVIGYDLLCTSVVTLDYKEPSIVVTAPSAFQYHGTGDVLPLSFKGRWPYVRGTLKVHGVDPVTDDFLIDTGSEDAVNHPVIRQSKGQLRQTSTGAGGFGQSLLESLARTNGFGSVSPPFQRRSQRAAPATT